MLPIKRGKVDIAKKVVIYGVEGIGKTSLAAAMPDPLFIDTEGSTQAYDVARLEPSSWEELMQYLTEIAFEPVCKTLVIDTIDWAMQMVSRFVCEKHRKKSIEDFGYGAGYKYIYEELEQFLAVLSNIRKTGVHVVIIAHSKLVKFELPEEAGSFDKYELKLDRNSSKTASQMIKEWADLVLFCNYRTHTVTAGNKHKATGGKKRCMYTAHSAVWDAKNRYGLPEELDLSYEPIAFLFEQNKPRDVETVEEKREIDTRIQKLMERDGIREDEIQDAVSQCLQVNKNPADYNLDLIEYILKEWKDLVEYIHTHECGLPF